MMKTLFATLCAAVLLVTSAPISALAEGHALTITNNGSHAIEYIQISPPSDNRWGDDWLDADQVVEPGDHVTFSITLGCLEDIKVTWMDHHTSEWQNFDTCQYDLRTTY